MHVGFVTPQDIARAWTFDVPVVAGLLVSAMLYAAGVHSLRRRVRRAHGIRRWRVAAFGGGLTAAAVALISPMAAAGGALFSAHMVQHMVLMLVAAPLLVLGAPMRVMLWAFTPHWRKRIGAISHTTWLRAAWHSLTNPVTAWTLHAIAIWVWHLPALFTLTLRSELAHATQHVSFFGTALLFWWVVAAPGRRRLPAGAAVLYVFTTAVHSSILGALLTFSDLPLYAEYGPGAAAWGLTVLEDQQLAGLIMWVPGGMLYLVAALAVLGAWLYSADRGPVLQQRFATGD